MARHKFNTNYWVVTGRLAENPSRAPWLGDNVIHIRLFLRDPFTPYEKEFQDKYFHPLDLYIEGLIGEVVFRNYKKGYYITLSGIMVSQRAVVRGKQMGVPKLIVDDIDLKWYMRDVPTNEDIGLPPAEYKIQAAISTDEEEATEQEQEIRRQVEKAKKEEQKQKPKMFY